MIRMPTNLDSGSFGKMFEIMAAGAVVFLGWLWRRVSGHSDKISGHSERLAVLDSQQEATKALQRLAVASSERIAVCESEANNFKGMMRGMSEDIKAMRRETSAGLSNVYDKIEKQKGN